MNSLLLNQGADSNSLTDQEETIIIRAFLYIWNLLTNEEPAKYHMLAVLDRNLARANKCKTSPIGVLLNGDANSVVF